MGQPPLRVISCARMTHSGPVTKPGCPRSLSRSENRQTHHDQPKNAHHATSTSLVVAACRLLRVYRAKTRWACDDLGFHRLHVSVT